MDGTTRRLTGALFTWADLGPAVLKGLPAPVRAWRALGESGLESRFEALRSGAAAPMVGRGKELEVLLQRWRRARSGEGQVVLLRGEAGIGKSRLTAALKEAIAAEACEELVLHCSPQHADTPLRPVVVRLERAAGLSPGDAPEARLAGLEDLLNPLHPPPEDVALLAELLATPTLGRWPALDLSPPARRAHLLRALARHLRGLAVQRPVLMVVEDAHWVDPTTRDLLDLIVAEAPGVALLLVVAHRPEFDADDWVGRPHVAALQLARLGRAGQQELLRRVARGKPVPAEVEAEVLARTDGVPLFVEEVGRAVLEGGLLREEADRWALDGPLPRLAVPATLQASLVARLDRLPSTREVAQAAAVIGREFTPDLLGRVSGLTEPALRAALDALVAADLVQRRGEPPELVYAFRHALIRDAAYGTLLRERRRDLHHRTAEAIERTRPEAVEREPEVLAYHRAEAGDAEAAAALYLRAGERSSTRSAFREARAHIACGLGLLPGLRTDAARRLEAGLRIALGNVATADAGAASAEAGQAFAEAVALCRPIADDALMPSAVWGLWLHKSLAGDLAGALPLAEEGVALARRHSTRDQRWRSLAALGRTHFLLGRFDLAQPFFEEVLAAPDAYEAGAGFGSGGSIAQPFLARVLGLRGKLEQAAVQAREAVERARQAGHLTSLLNALVVCCAQDHVVGDAASLRSRVAELGSVAEAHGYPFYAARTRFYRGWALVEEGRVTEGIRLMGDGLAVLRHTGTGLFAPQSEAMIAEAHLRAGDAEAALAGVEAALRVATRTGEAWFDAELHRRLGRVLLRRGRPGDTGRAEGAFRRALGIARSQSALLFDMRAARDLARLLREQGRVAEARDIVAPVYGSFTEGFGCPDLVEARALLAELGAPGSVRSPS